MTYWVNYVKDLRISRTIYWVSANQTSHLLSKLHFFSFYLSASSTMSMTGRCSNPLTHVFCVHRLAGWCGTGWCRRWRWEPLWFYTTDRHWCPRPTCCGTWQTSLGELVKHTGTKAATNSRDSHWKKTHFFSYYTVVHLLMSSAIVFLNNDFVHNGVHCLNGRKLAKLPKANMWRVWA